MTPKVAPLTEAERAWVSGQLIAADQFVARYSPSDTGQALSLAALDRAFAAWLALDIRDSDQVNAAINTVGIAFGSLLVERSGFSWVIASDQTGTDLAVHALPGTGDILVYPANFVAKRWERGEASFLTSAFDRISREAETIRGRWAGSGNKRPWWRFWSA